MSAHVEESFDDDIRLDVPLEPACSSARCYTIKAVNFVFDGMSLPLLSNLFSLWTKWTDLMSYLLETRFTKLMQFVGFVILFVVLNVLAYVYFRIVDVVAQITKAVVLFFHFAYCSTRLWSCCVSLEFLC